MLINVEVEAKVDYHWLMLKRDDVETPSLMMMAFATEGDDKLNIEDNATRNRVTYVQS
jgi:hypothetical protein